MKCIATELTLPQARRLGKHLVAGQQFPIELGLEYVCFGVRVWSAGAWVDVEGPSGYLVTVPLCLFSIVDGTLPDAWKARQDDAGDLSLQPDALADPYFLDDLSEGKPEALAAFRELKARWGVHGHY